MPASVKALSFPPYSAGKGISDELTAKDQLDEEVYDRSAGDEEQGGHGGWDEEEDIKGEEEDKGWLDDDDIQDF